MTRDVATAQAKLADARRAAVAAIDAELAAGATGPRAQQLTADRAKLAPANSGVHKIVIPNSDLDPLADPEDLDKEAGALKQTEGELQHQVDELDRQTAALKSWRMRARSTTARSSSRCAMTTSRIADRRAR